MASAAAQAFMQGSPSFSGGAGLGSLPGLAAGLPSIPSLTQSSSADGHVTAGFNNSGFVVNLKGGAASVGAALPSWALPAAAVAGLVLFLRKRGTL